MQKTLQDFINQFRGHGIDYDHRYGAQCYDVIQEWNVDWLNNRFLPGDYAYQLLNKNPDQYTTYLNNSATAHPDAGDIVVFSNNYNHIGGHTGIATGNGVAEGKPTDWLEIVEQNDPLGSTVQVRRYPYTYVTGWLRSKKSPGLTSDQKLSSIKDIVNGAGSGDQKIDRIRPLVN